MPENNIQTVAIIGGGLVGSLCASFMAKNGYRVQIFEYREDIRQTKFAQGRSINLALSNRGRRALKAVGLEDLVLEAAIPMKGRFLHSKEGSTKSVPYDKHTNQCIYSVGRNYLNGILLTAAEQYTNVEAFFNHKLIDCNFEAGTVTIMDTKRHETKTVTANLIIGADGAFSRMRRCMQQTPLFEFSQTYIKHGYIELTIPPARGHKMAPNHLHIWPRGELMMIALPNQDGSWTVTLFMPFAKFDNLTDESTVLHFFATTFQDAVPLIGEEELVKVVLKAKPSPLLSIKCHPYHVGENFLLIGDAAHAIVPFYGQGMNAGFEDCVIFDEILKRNGNNVGGAIREFSGTRPDDCCAISDLAMYNYVEMRDLVTRRSYQFRKVFDDLMFRWFPSKWVPLYNSVTFSQIEYKKCLQNRHWQDQVIGKVAWGVAAAGFVCASYFVYGLVR